MSNPPQSGGTDDITHLAKRQKLNGNNNNNNPNVLLGGSNPLALLLASNLPATTAGGSVTTQKKQHIAQKGNMAADYQSLAEQEKQRNHLLNFDLTVPSALPLQNTTNTAQTTNNNNTSSAPTTLAGLRKRAMGLKTNQTHNMAAPTNMGVLGLGALNTALPLPTQQQQQQTQQQTHNILSGLPGLPMFDNGNNNNNKNNNMPAPPTSGKSVLEQLLAGSIPLPGAPNVVDILPTEQSKQQEEDKMSDDVIITTKAEKTTTTPSTINLEQKQQQQQPKDNASQQTSTMSDDTNTTTPNTTTATSTTTSKYTFDITSLNNNALPSARDVIKQKRKETRKLWKARVQAERKATNAARSATKRSHSAMMMADDEDNNDNNKKENEIELTEHEQDKSVVHFIKLARDAGVIKVPKKDATGEDDIDLTYLAEDGTVLSGKEAFKQQSRIFHGTKVSKNTAPKKGTDTKSGAAKGKELTFVQQAEQLKAVSHQTMKDLQRQKLEQFRLKQQQQQKK